VAPKDTGEVVHEVRITAALDDHAAEALRLELRRLAKQYGARIEELRLERADGDPSA
jgi:hypothetical protein